MRHQLRAMLMRLFRPAAQASAAAAQSSAGTDTKRETRAVERAHAEARTETVDGALSGYAIVLELPIAWGEMDALGHVNNVVFFRYFESARIAYLRAIGFIGDGEHGRIGPILASTHCRFRRPLQFPDRVFVGARATEVGADRFVMEYRIVSATAGELAAEGGGVVVAYDYAAQSKAALPHVVLQRIRELEAAVPALHRTRS